MNRSRALSLLFANILGLPGLGSLMGGKRVGWIQIGVSLVSLLLLGIWFVKFVFEFLNWAQTGDFRWGWGYYSWCGGVGWISSIAVWLWGLGTGLQMLREAKNKNKPPMLSDSHSPSSSVVDPQSR